MDLDKNIVKAERKILEEIINICGVNFRRINMRSTNVKENYYNYNTEGNIIMLGFDFISIDLGGVNLSQLADLIAKLENLIRLVVSQSKEKLSLDWIKDLKFIKELEILRSSITEIPDFLKEFKNLEELTLEWNEIKYLPGWLPTLPALKKFSLWNSKPTLELNQENLDVLKALEDKNVEITDRLYNLYFKCGLPIDQVRILRSMTDKKGRNRVRCRILESIKDEIGYYEKWNIEVHVFEGKIIWMAMEECKLETLPEDFGKLEVLLGILLKGNRLESLPDSFGELEQLKILNLANNQLKSLPESFVNLTNLQKLDLSNNQLEEIPTQLWALKVITDLDLSGNPLSAEESTIIQKVPDLIRKYLRNKATIRVFISHAVIDFEPYRIGELQQYLENQKEISQVFYCEQDLAGNIDEWMLNAVQKCQLILFIGTNKSVFDSVDCANELQLAEKFSIPVIPIKGKDVDWPDLAERGLSRELGLEYDVDNFDDFCEDTYAYIENFKREINLMEKGERHKGITDIYERFRLILDEKLSEIVRKIDALGDRISKLEKGN